MSTTVAASPNDIDFESPNTNPALLDLLGSFLYHFARLQDGSPESLRAYDSLVACVVDEIHHRFRFDPLVDLRTDDSLNILAAVRCWFSTRLPPLRAMPYIVTPNTGSLGRPVTTDRSPYSLDASPTISPYEHTFASMPSFRPPVLARSFRDPLRDPRCRVFTAGPKVEVEVALSTPKAGLTHLPPDVVALTVGPRVATLVSPDKETTMQHQRSIDIKKTPDNINSPSKTQKRRRGLDVTGQGYALPLTLVNIVHDKPMKTT